MGRLDEARNHYQKANEDNPEYADDHLKLAVVLDQKGKSQEAARYFSEALRINPKDREARRNLQKVQQLLKTKRVMWNDANSSPKISHQTRKGSQQIPIIFDDIDKIHDRSK
jgi:tetratricopeptide (TPR) repeat protein